MTNIPIWMCIPFAGLLLCIAVFPLVKKYGGVVVALTLDERGIPKTAHERVEIAKKIIATAEEYGIEKKDIVFEKDVDTGIISRSGMIIDDTEYVSNEED